MSRYISAAILYLLFSVASLHASECSVQLYSSLVTDAKAADEARQWQQSNDIYNRIINECAALINPGDLAKAYDALSVAQLMSENYSSAIDTAKKCLELDNRLNSCMMTSAKAYEGLGDRDMAISFAKSAIEVGGYDDYSTAMVIFAKSYLQKMEKGGK